MLSYYLSSNTTNIAPLSYHLINHLCKRDNDGVRFSWNAWPNTRIKPLGNIIAIFALYTPLKYRQIIKYVPGPVSRAEAPVEPS
jgi:hypothetical protein